MVLPPTPSPTCYKDYCNDPALTGLSSIGLYKAQLGEIYDSWSTDVKAPLTTDELLEEVVMGMSQGMPGGILVFVTDANHVGGVARVLHNLRSHTDRGEHRGSLFAYVGDVADQDIELVYFDNDVLAEIPLEVKIRTNVDAHIQLLAADANVQLAAEPDDADLEANTAKRHCARGSMFIPAPLMPYVMTNPLMNAKQTLDVLITAMRGLDLEDTCGPLIDFLMYATTDSAAGASPRNVQLRAGDAFINPVQVARARRNAILHAQLPILRPSPNGRDQALHGLLGAIYFIVMWNVVIVIANRINNFAIAVAIVIVIVIAIAIAIAIFSFLTLKETSKNKRSTSKC